MNPLATVELISEMRPHTNADALELAYVGGWQHVCRKVENYKVGDKIIYVRPDTMLPEKKWNLFLRKDNEKGAIRLKTIKMRGEISEGLFLRLTDPDDFFEVGQDVSLALGLTKYEKPESVSTKNAKGSFPHDIIPKTDEENIKNIRNRIFEEIGEMELYASMKIDGTSSTFIHKDNTFERCSRSLTLKENDSNEYNLIVKRYALEEKMKTLGYDIAIQGEIYGRTNTGKGLNGNQWKLDTTEFAMFTARNLATGEYFGMNELIQLSQQLEIPMVPILKVFKMSEFGNYENLKAWVNSLKHVNPKGETVPVEGVVIRPVKNTYSPYLRKPLSFKMIVDGYKD